MLALPASFGALLLVLLVSFAPAASVISQIDGFDGPMQSLEVIGVGVESDTAASSVLGGSREATLMVTSNPNTFDALFEVDFGLAFLDLGPGVDGSGSLRYSPSAGVDLSGGGANGIVVRVAYADQPFTLEINAIGGGALGSVRQAVGSSVTGTDVLFAFSDLPTVDFSDVTSFELVAIPDLPGSDLVFDLVGTAVVPEPSALLLVLAGASTLLVRRRR